ncbi:hypothetical protein KP509_33G024400 [Ceratopteris richardii]|nr:hypothetical protein KP509_33G024400 [Ceratopteris richardii]
MGPSPIFQTIDDLIQMIDMLAEKSLDLTSNCKHVAANIKIMKIALDELQQNPNLLSADVVSILEELKDTCLKLKERFNCGYGRSSKLVSALQKQQEFKELQCHLRALQLEILNLSKHDEEIVEKYNDFLEMEGSALEMNNCLVEEIKHALAEVMVGNKMNHETLATLAMKLGFESNWEILKEASILEKEMDMARLKRNKNEEELLNLLVLFVMKMSDNLMEQKHLKAEAEGISVPTDFRCPLSLEIMSDPVIIASGQTYERAYIQMWLDEGNTTCPKSRQTLSDLNIFSNITLKGMIECWCEDNNLPLHNLSKCEGLEPGPSLMHMNQMTQKLGKSSKSLLTFEHAIHESKNRTDMTAMKTLSQKCVESECKREITTIKESLNENQDASHSHLELPTLEHPEERPCRLRIGDSVGGVSTASSNMLIPNLASKCGYSDGPSRLLDGDGHVFPEVECYQSIPRCSVLSVGQLMENTRLEAHQSMQSGVQTNDKGDDLELRVRGLVRDLQSAPDLQRAAACELRLLGKSNVKSRSIMTNCGAIPLLISLLDSTDPQTQLNAATALLNLSIDHNNKHEIVRSNVIEPLIHVLEYGTTEAKENAAAIVFNLSVTKEIRDQIGRSRAIEPLINLVSNGTLQGKKDATTALYNLSLFHKNNLRIVRAKAVGPMIRLMSNPALGMVERASLVIANLATTREGKDSIGKEGGVSVLLDVLETGSQRGKEAAATALYHLCSYSGKFKSRVWQEGAIPYLIALTKTGTTKAKEKASYLIDIFKERHHGTGAL